MADWKMKEVWTVCERGEGKKPFWLRIGTVFENKDGSWGGTLDALPVNGKIIVRDKKEWDGDDGPRKGGGRGEEIPF